MLILFVFIRSEIPRLSNGLNKIMYCRENLRLTKFTVNKFWQNYIPKYKFNSDTTINLQKRSKLDEGV